MGSLVTLQYMTALRARDQVEVAHRQVERSVENLEIAQARVDAQAAIVTDAKQAQVQVGRDSVSLIQAESALRVGILGLLETVGLNLGADVDLVSQFEVFRPSWTSTELISIALESHPRLNAFVASEGARRANLRQARGEYFPTLSLSGTWAGFTAGGPERAIFRQRCRIECRQNRGELRAVQWHFVGAEFAAGGVPPELLGTGALR